MKPQSFEHPVARALAALGIAASLVVPPLLLRSSAAAPAHVTAPPGATLRTVPWTAPAQVIRTHVVHPVPQPTPVAAAPVARPQTTRLAVVRVPLPPPVRRPPPPAGRRPRGPPPPPPPPPPALAAPAAPPAASAPQEHGHGHAFGHSKGHAHGSAHGGKPEQAAHGNGHGNDHGKGKHHDQDSHV